MKNRIAGLLMETGTLYNKKCLHGKAYFSDLLGTLQETPASVVELLKLSRAQLEIFETVQHRLLKGLRENRELAKRVERLQSIQGVGVICGPDVGVGDRRGGAVRFDRAGGQLLRTDQRGEQFGGQRTAPANLEAPQISICKPY